MTERLQVYQCKLCGNMVELLQAGKGELACCGQPMKLLKERTADSATEKHVPVVEKVDEGVKVTVGSTLHPMEDKHFIQWVEVISDGKSYRQFLKPGEPPVAIFPLRNLPEKAREYCNLHGLWKWEPE